MRSLRLEKLLIMYNEHPKDEFILFALAKEFESLTDFSEAEEYYKLLIEANQNYVGVYYHYAQLLVNLERIDEAIAIFDRGIEVSTKIGDVHALGELRNAKLNVELGL